MKKSYFFWFMVGVHLALWCMLTYMSTVEEFSLFRHVASSIQAAAIPLGILVALMHHYLEKS